MNKPTLPEWATLSAKKQEKFKPEDVHNWRDNLRRYKKDPAQYAARIKSVTDMFSDSIKEGAAAGDCIEAGKSKNPELLAMQEAINRMAISSGQIKFPPKLFIMPDDLDDDRENPKLNAWTYTSEIILITDYTKNYLLAHPEQFKVLMAHEMAHIANGDNEIENKVQYGIVPANKKREVLAERMAAIIHGNPQQYAKYKTEFLIYEAKAYGKEPHTYSQEYPSPNSEARMLRKWAKILEREGATDKNGNVIMEADNDGIAKPLKALAIFERSKSLAEDLVKIEQLRQR